MSKTVDRTARLAIMVALTIATPVAHAAKPDGAMLFAVHCASCHGSDAQGGGPVASVMKIAVPNLRMLAKRNGGAFPADEVTAYIDGRKEVASHGDRVMPVWGDALMLPNDRGRSGVRARIAALVAYIEQLQDR